jgi:hypothetical protein
MVADSAGKIETRRARRLHVRNCRGAHRGPSDRRHPGQGEGFAGAFDAVKCAVRFVPAFRPERAKQLPKDRSRRLGPRIVHDRCIIRRTEGNIRTPEHDCFRAMRSGSGAPLFQSAIHAFRPFSLIANWLYFRKVRDIIQVGFEDKVNIGRSDIVARRIKSVESAIIALFRSFPPPARSLKITSEPRLAQAHAGSNDHPDSDPNSNTLEDVQNRRIELWAK